MSLFGCAIIKIIYIQSKTELERSNGFYSYQENAKAVGAVGSVKVMVTAPICKLWRVTVV